ncbi:MAG: flagellar assembly protein FliW [Bacillota bacterium]|nr:flagellar assembly protein FliW [Bacillota bacterium]
MKLITTHIGEIEYAPSAVIRFEEGIPGFESYKEYILVFSEDPALPFHYLQSIERADLALIVTSPFLFVEDYDFELPDEVVNKLDIKSPEELYVYSVVTIPHKVEHATINLTAPIIINTTNHRAKQVILTDIDDVRHPLFLKRG